MAVLAAATLAYLAVVVWGSSRLSPAYDEPAHIRSGLNMLTRDAYADPVAAPWTRPNPVHPPSDVLPALLALWSGQSLDCRGGSEVEFAHLRAARWANHLLGAATLVLVWLFARDLWGSWPALLAPALLAVQPIFVAHGTVVSSDLYGALGGLAAVWVVWRLHLADPVQGTSGGEWARVVLAGLVFALALLAKLSNLALLPVLLLAPLAGVVAAAGGVRNVPPRRALRTLAAGGMSVTGALLVTALVYDATHAVLPPLVIGGNTVELPFAHALAVCVQIAGNLKEYLYPPYFAGSIVAPSPQLYGIALAVKTPLGALVISLAALFVAAARVDVKGRRRGALLLLALVAGLVTVFTSRGFYLGLRHLLLPLVLLAPLAGALGAGAVRARKRRPALSLLVLGALAWAATDVARALPWTIEYFNPLARGRVPLVDSDGDWGEGLLALAAWQRRTSGDEPVWLSYFGGVRPESYGITYRGMPSPFSPVRQDPEGWRASDPAAVSGWVVISRTHLAGTYFATDGSSSDFYAAWRGRLPDRVIGGSLLVFDNRPARP